MKGRRKIEIAAPRITRLASAQPPRKGMTNFDTLAFVKRGSAGRPGRVRGSVTPRGLGACSRSSGIINICF